MGIGSAARSAPDKVAIVSQGRTLTFGELDERQGRLVGMLRSAGIEHGDRIAVWSRNRPELLEVTIAALRAGVVPVPLHPLLTSPEIAYALEDSGARWLFADDPLEPPPTLERMIVFGDAYERALHDSTAAEMADHALGRPMHYTSGTTGRAKGVWVAPYTEAHAARVSSAFRDQWAISGEDMFLVCSPLAHSAPHRFSTRTLEAGGAVALLHRFDPAEILVAIELFSVTSTFMVPTHLERIRALGTRAAARNDLSSLRLLAHAGAPIAEATKRWAIETFPTGSVWEFYGSTEGQATRISSAEWIRKPGSVGTPSPRAHVAIRDEEGRVVGPDEIGEVWIEDPDADRFEYWGDPEKTRAAWRGNAFTAGDLGWLDGDGYLFLSGRLNDTIISGGVNVYPREVENALLDHPAVAEAVVFGVDDPDWGQEVRARIVPAYGQPLDPESLLGWLRERLAAFKCPKRIEVVDEIPRTPTGKPMRPQS